MKFWRGLGVGLLFMLPLWALATAAVLVFVLGNA